MKRALLITLALVCAASSAQAGVSAREFIDVQQKVENIRKGKDRTFNRMLERAVKREIERQGLDAAPAATSFRLSGAHLQRLKEYLLRQPEFQKGTGTEPDFNRAITRWITDACRPDGFLRDQLKSWVEDVAYDAGQRGASAELDRRGVAIQTAASGGSGDRTIVAYALSIPFHDGVGHGVRLGRDFADGPFGSRVTWSLMMGSSAEAEGTGADVQLGTEFTALWPLVGCKSSTIVCWRLGVGGAVLWDTGVLRRSAEIVPGANIASRLRVGPLFLRLDLLVGARATRVLDEDGIEHGTVAAWAPLTIGGGVLF